MLVLTRKLGEVIRVGDSVIIKVLEIRPGQVKLGIEAPPKVKVHREEIYDRIQEEKRRAGRPPGAEPDQPPTVRPDDPARGPLFLRLIKGRKIKPA